MNLDTDTDLTVERLQRQGAALRALGRRLLGEATADDLVQETYLVALRGRSPSGAVGAWLHGIAGKLALLMRRRALRQQRREQHVAGAAMSPSAADAAASVEMIQRITDAVRSLPDAYRTAVVLRFWHDLPPRTIARELRLSVHTVRSRLQRALAMLRERLDEGYGGRSAWITPIECLLRLPAAGVGAPAAAATLFAGVSSMAMKLYLGAAAVVLLAGAWGVGWWWEEPSALLQTHAGSDAAMVAAESSGGQPGPVERHLVAAEPTQLTGRCVAAEGGAPLAGCRVVLLQKRSRQEPASKPQVLTTGADGRFEVSLRADVGREYQLLFGIAERIVDSRSFAALPVGPVQVGDVALTLGAMVYGTVHTASGQPAANVAVECRLEPMPGEPVAVEATTRVLSSRGDGVLQQDEFAFAPGHWNLTLHSPDHELVNPRSFEILPGQRRVELEVVTVALADLPAISGVLVDEAGVPVGGVNLFAGNTANRAVSGPDGAFVVHRRIGEDKPVRLSLQASAICALRDPEAAYAWGSREQRVTVQRPGGLALHVVNAATGAAVPKFGVRLQPLDPGSDSQTYPVLQHENGLLQLQRVKAGHYRIVAFPDDPELAPSEPVEVLLGTSGALLELACEPAQWFTVVVQTAAGEPVAGAFVDLLRREGRGELTEQSLVGTQDYVAQYLIADRFVVVASGRTDTRGELALRGPSRGYLGLRARGAFVARLLAPVVLGGPDRRVVLQVERGAVLQGVLTPAALLAELRPSADSGPRGNGPWVDDNEHLGTRSRQGATLQLRSGEAGRPRVLPKRMVMGEPGFPIAVDGAFQIEGIPPGDWTVELLYAIDGRNQQRVLGKAAGLRDGERRQMALSLADLVPGELRAVVLRNGAPWANAEIYCNSGWLRTDTRGHLDRRVSPGSYWLEAEIGEGPDHRLYSDQQVVVRPGEVTKATIDFVRRRARMHVLDADGAPVRNRAFQVTGFGSSLATDAEGWLLLDPSPPWPCTLAYYEGWLDSAAMEQLAQRDDTARARLRRELGPVPMPLDRPTAEIEVRLPR